MQSKTQTVPTLPTEKTEKLANRSIQARMSPTSSSTFQLVMHKTVPTQTATKLKWTKPTKSIKHVQHRKFAGSAHPTENLVNRFIRMSPTSSSTFQTCHS
jgi:hypothetical protein